MATEDTKDSENKMNYDMNNTKFANLTNQTTNSSTYQMNSSHIQAPKNTTHYEPRTNFYDKNLEMGDPVSQYCCLVYKSAAFSIITDGIFSGKVRNHS